MRVAQGVPGAHKDICHSCGEMVAFYFAVSMTSASRRKSTRRRQKEGTWWAKQKEKEQVTAEKESRMKHKSQCKYYMNGYCKNVSVSLCRYVCTFLHPSSLPLLSSLSPFPSPPPLFPHPLPLLLSPFSPLFPLPCLLPSLPSHVLSPLPLPSPLVPALLLLPLIFPVLPSPLLSLPSPPPFLPSLPLLLFSFLSSLPCPPLSSFSSPLLPSPLLSLPSPSFPLHPQGDCCDFSHEGTPNKKKDVCKFYLMDSCMKGKDCIFHHGECQTYARVAKLGLTNLCILLCTGDFPCKFYHTKKYCKNGDQCKFSHAPLTSETRELLLSVSRPSY